MIVATTRNVAEIRGCAKQLIRNKLLIEQGLEVCPEATAKGRGWHLRLSRRRGNEPFARPKRLVGTWFVIDPVNWRSTASLVNIIYILGVAPLWQSVDDLARHLPNHPTASPSPLKTGWLYFAATNGQVARTIDLGMTSFGLLAPIDIGAKYVLPGRSLETRFIARSMV